MIKPEATGWRGGLAQMLPSLCSVYQITARKRGMRAIGVRARAPVVARGAVRVASVCSAQHDDGGNL